MEPKQQTEKQTTQKNWLDEELETQKSPLSHGERLPSLQFVENKVVTFVVDFSAPFKKWTQTESNGKTKTKAIILVTHKGEKKNLWLNCANPLYRELLERGNKGQTQFSVTQNGTQDKTKYAVVEEE